MPVLSRLVPTSHDAPVRDLSTDPFVGTIVLCLCALAFVVLSLAAGMTWERLLHWTGELLLVIGVLLAAKGISDVRREWTSRPGIWGRIREIRAHAVAFLWACWNWIVKWTWLARLLHLHPHGKVISGSADLGLGRMTVNATAQVSFDAAPANATVEERLTWLENRLVEAGRQIATLHAWHAQEVRDRHGTDRQPHRKKRRPGWPRTSASGIAWPTLLAAACGYRYGAWYACCSAAS